MNIHISQFTIESYDEVFRLWQQCTGIGLSHADSRESILAYLERNLGMSFIATSNGRVAGAVLSGHDGRRGYLHHLAVHPEHRRQGLARQLVDRCLVALAEVGIRKCHIFIFNENERGIAFWKSVGWTPRPDIRIISKTMDPNPGDREQSRSR